MKIEGIMYFIGLAFGLWMAKSFWRVAWFLSIIGMVLMLMGLLGYAMMIHSWHKNRKRGRKCILRK